VVAGTKTAARLTGLAGGSPYTFVVKAGNPYGDGLAVTSGAETPTGPPAPYAAQVEAASPAAYYRLGESAGLTVGADSAGKGRLIGYGQATLRAAGALRYDTDLAVTADGNCCLGTATPALPGYDSDRTVEVWVRPLDRFNRGVLGWGRQETGMGFTVGVVDDSVVVSDYGDDLTFRGSRTLVDGAWHHVVVTYHAGTVVAYVDGSAIGGKAFPAPLDTVDESGLVVGARFDGGAPFYGGLDEVAVYPTALTAATVAAHFAASGHAVPPAVTGLAATAGANRASVSWTQPASADPVTSYLVAALRAGVPVDAVAVPGTATSATVSGLLGGVGYTVRVVPRNRYGTGASAASAAVTPTGATSTYASTVLADGPGAYYRLGEPPGVDVGADSSGRAPPSSTGHGAFGVPGALVGDGDTAATADGGCCLATAAATLPTGAAARTVEAWVRPADAVGRWFAAWGRPELDRGFAVGVQDDAVLVSGYGDDLTFRVGRSLVDGAWHHIAVSYSGTVAAAYVDGAAVGSKAFTDTLATGSGTALLIGSGVGGAGPFYGGLDELAVYRSALPAARVAAHFAASGHGVPKAATGAAVVARANGASVSWVKPASADPLAWYVVTAVRNGAPVNAVAVPGSSTTADLTGLAGGTGYAVRIVAADAYGAGPAATTAAFTPTGTASTYSTAVLGNAPLAYYRLGEHTGIPVAADSSGTTALLRGLRGTLGDPGALRTDVDTAVTLDGGCCLGTTTTTVPKYNSPRAVEAWVRPADGYPRWLLGWGTAATDRLFDVGLDDGRLLVSAYNDDLRFPLGRSIVDGSWHQVVVSYDGAGTVTGYLDGVSLGGRAFRAPLNTVTAGTLWLGSGADGSSPFYGGLDEVAVYGAALTPAEVKAHFDASGHAAPGGVTGLAVTPQPNAVAVSWAAASSPDGVSRYTVTAVKAGVPGNSVVVRGGATSATLTGLASGSAYTVRVMAGNAYGDGRATTSPTATPSGTARTYASAVLANAPSAYYRLGEDSGVAWGADSSGRAGVLTYRAGLTAQGVTGALPDDPDPSVTANGGCCVGTSVASLPAFDSPRSVEAWVKPADGAARWFVGWGTNVTDRAFAVGVQDSAVVVSAAGDDLSIPVGHSLLDGGWHHLAVAVTGTTATAYVDGVPVGSARFTASALNTVTNGTLWVGASTDGGGPFYGGLDEVAVYPTALTAAQVVAHYAAR